MKKIALICAALLALTLTGCKKAEKTAAKIQQTTQIANVNQKTFDKGLKKSSGVFKSALDSLVQQHKKVDVSMLESIEEMLISFDVGTGATPKIMKAIEDEIKAGINVKMPGGDRDAVAYGCSSSRIKCKVEDQRRTPFLRAWTTGLLHGRC